MQLTTNTMAYSNEMSLALPPMLKGTSGGGAYRMHTARNAYGKQPQLHRPHPKSQPFDPEDLRRRLYVVIAEREAQNERRQRQRVDALPAKKAQVERERDIQHLFIERLAATADRPAADSKATSRWSGSLSRSNNKLQSSRQDKLRHRASMTASSDSTDRNTSATGGGYRHIPEQAAAQFSRTTTSTGMQGGDNHKSLVHSLSRAALRFYSEGPSSSADRRAIDTSITPGRQRSLLQRGRAQQEKQHGRNQFQNADVAAAAGRSRQPSTKSGPEKTTMTIEEEGGHGASALADLHLHTYASQSSGGGGNGGGGSSNGGGGERGGEIHSSEETLVDAATANEHRVDWSQSDELLPHEKRGMKLLRKTTSILTMKLGHRRKNSADSNSNGEGISVNIENNNKNKNSGMHQQQQQQQQQLRIVTIHEHCDEQAEADADDGSTPMSPKSGNSRTGRIGIWERLKRG